MEESLLSVDIFAAVLGSPISSAASFESPGRSHSSKITGSPLHSRLNHRVRAPECEPAAGQLFSESYASR